MKHKEGRREKIGLQQKKLGIKNGEMKRIKIIRAQGILKNW